MFFTIAENHKGEKTVTGYYNQWGIGRIMPMAAMTCIMNCERRGYDVGVADGLVFDPKAQGYHQVFRDSYREDDKLATKVWNNPRMIGEIAAGQDNNNGAVVLYAKELDDSGHSEVSYRLGFLLGEEDEYHVYSDGTKWGDESLGRAFSRWLTLEEWAALQINMPYTGEKFRSWFKGFMEEFGVEVKSWNN